MSKYIKFFLLVLGLSFIKLSLATEEIVGEYIPPENDVSNSTQASNSYSSSIPEGIVGEPVQVGGISGEPIRCNTLGPVGLQVDRHLSPITGAEALTTVLAGYKWLDDTYLPCTTGDSSFSMIAARFGKFLFEYIIFQPLMVTQHEVFGHGFRAREFGIHVYDYSIKFFGSGSTSYDALKYNTLSPHEKIAFIAGGIESTNIFAKRIRDGWLKTARMDNRDATLYMLNELSQANYIYTTRTRNQFTKGHDIFDYVREVNNWFGRQVLTTKKLRRQTLIDYANPFYFYSLYSIGQYILDGTQTLEYPMFRIGEYRYLPALHMVLAPFGLEYNMMNFITCGDQVFQATLRYGNTGGRHSYGLALESSRLWSTDIIWLDGKLDLWSQPKFFTLNAGIGKNHLGLALSAIGHYKFAECAELMGQVGYKTTGFMQGEELRRSPILRAGILFNF